MTIQSKLADKIAYDDDLHEDLSAILENVYDELFTEPEVLNKIELLHRKHEFIQDTLDEIRSVIYATVENNL